MSSWLKHLKGLQTATPTTPLDVDRLKKDFYTYCSTRGIEYLAAVDVVAHPEPSGPPSYWFNIIDENGLEAISSVYLSPAMSHDEAYNLIVQAVNKI